MRGESLLNAEGHSVWQSLKAGFKGTVKTGERQPDKWLWTEKAVLPDIEEASTAWGIRSSRLMEG